MEKTLTYEFCEITIFSHYVVAVMHEGINLTPEHNEVLKEISETYFKETPFVYITHRIHSYSVDPQIYFETSKIPNLKGFAVVSSDYKAKTNAKIEKMFFTKPFKIFASLEEAKDWADKIVAS